MGRNRQFPSQIDPQCCCHRVDILCHRQRDLYLKEQVVFGKCKIDIVNYASTAVGKGCAGVTRESG